MALRANLPSHGYLGAARVAGGGRDVTWRPTTYTAGGRVGSIGHRKGLANVSTSTLNELEDWMNNLSHSIEALRYGMGALTMILARVNHAQSLERSRGIYDPYRQRNQYAWKIPVRMISTRYFRGWKIKRLAPGIWMVYNDSREAYFIEFGIHIGSNRVRRPVRKLSLIWTLRWAERSRIYHRVWDDVFMPRRGGRIGMTGTTLGNAYAGVGVQSPAQNMGGYQGGSF